MAEVSLGSCDVLFAAGVRHLATRSSPSPTSPRGYPYKGPPGVHEVQDHGVP